MIAYKFRNESIKTFKFYVIFNFFNFIRNWDFVVFSWSLSQLAPPSLRPCDPSGSSALIVHIMILRCGTQPTRVSMVVIEFHTCFCDLTRSLTAITGSTRYLGPCPPETFQGLTSCSGQLCQLPVPQRPFVGWPVAQGIIGLVSVVTCLNNMTSTQHNGQFNTMVSSTQQIWMIN